MNREGINRDFFYMYDCLFRGLHVRVPFDNFAMGVLLIFNVAPMQLHPNGWVAMQAFHYDKYPKELLSPDERQDLKFLETLPRQLPARPLGSLLQSPNLARQNRIVAASGPSSNPTAKRTSGPHEGLADVVPSVDKHPKGKQKHTKQSHREHRSGLREQSRHREGTSREKRLKQPMLKVSTYCCCHHLRHGQNVDS
ncbi:hypothetical protein JHK85_013245 [Glycine max]|nr:hypothetical protein JHK85_013245 [Glycine max]